MTHRSKTVLLGHEITKSLKSSFTLFSRYRVRKKNQDTSYHKHSLPFLRILKNMNVLFSSILYTTFFQLFFRLLFIKSECVSAEILAERTCFSRPQNCTQLLLELPIVTTLLLNKIPFSLFLKSFKLLHVY